MNWVFAYNSISMDCTIKDRHGPCKIYEPQIVLIIPASGVPIHFILNIDNENICRREISF